MVARSDDHFHPVRWIVFLLLMFAIAGGLGSAGGLGRADLRLVDAVRLFDHSSHREDVVIVAIDDASLNSMGPLPWAGTVYERLLDTLSASQPRAIGMLTPWNRRYLSIRSEEGALAEAVARTGNLVLPVVMTGAQGRTPLAVPPAASFAAAAESLGHVHTLLDSDGMARSVFLREGPRSNPWDHIALALYKLGAGDGSEDALWQRLPDDGTSDWVADNQLIVPFTRSSVKHIPMVDVLAGIVAPEQFRNRYVLIGATATGVGNAFATPVSSRGSLMPEPDMVAAVLQALLDQRYVHPAGPGLNAIANMVPALLGAVALALLPTAAALVALTAIVVAVLGGTALLPLVADVQVYPVASLVALLLAYPVWSGLRLFSAFRSLSAEIIDMPHSMFPPMPAAAPGADMIERHIGRLHDAIEQLRTTQRLVNDSLDSAPM